MPIGRLRFCLLFLIFPSFIARSEERNSPTLATPRFLGRGNTYVAAWDSEDATRANPATLREQNLKFQLRPFPIDFMVGENSVGTFLDILDTVQNSSSDDLVVDMFKVFGEQFGKRQFAHLQLTPLSMRILSFEISPFLSVSGFVDPRIPQIPELSVRFDTTAGANLSLSLPLTKTIDIGATLRPMTRIYYAQSMSFIDFVTVLTDSDSEAIKELTGAKSGFGLGVDLGLIYRPTPLLRFGVTTHDAGYTSFKGDPSPPAKPQTISLGAGARKKIGKWNWDSFFDFQDILNSGDVSYLRLLNLGTELGYSYTTKDNDLGITLGLNEGYLAFGVFADIWILRLDIANYGVELGEVPGQRQDRRWAFAAKLFTMSI